MRARWLVVSAALAAASVGPVAAARAAATCAPDAEDMPRAVARVLDSETVLLDDGTEVRLVGALPPRPATLRVPAADWPPAREAARALEALVAGRSIALRYETGARRDRYGRRLAQVSVDAPDGRQWVQERLIRSGDARAYALPGRGACLPQLLAAERAARAERAGLWSEPAFAPRRALDVEALLRLAGSFVLVEGRVASVTHRTRETYVNFDRDWRRDFTAVLPGKMVKQTPATRARLDALVGRTVRVRGWIERRNGPSVALGSLDEIELLESPADRMPED